MTTYQVPQFLDSGDKIIGPMNIRQLGYVLIGGGLAVGLYLLLNSFIGIASLIIAAPFALISTYLAIGQYNGRDAEFYVLKMIEYFKKEKSLKYKKVPQTPKLDERLTKLVPKVIDEEIHQRYVEVITQQKGKESFNLQSENIKQQRIQQLTEIVDNRREVNYKVLNQLEAQNRELDSSLVKPKQEDSIYKKYTHKGPEVVPKTPKLSPQ